MNLFKQFLILTWLVKCVELPHCHHPGIKSPLGNNASFLPPFTGKPLVFLWRESQPCSTSSTFISSRPAWASSQQRARACCTSFSMQRWWRCWWLTQLMRASSWHRCGRSALPARHSISISISITADGWHMVRHRAAYPDEQALHNCRQHKQQHLSHTAFSPALNTKCTFVYLLLHARCPISRHCNLWKTSVKRRARQ